MGAGEAVCAQVLARAAAQCCLLLLLLRPAACCCCSATCCCLLLLLCDLLLPAACCCSATCCWRANATAANDPLLTPVYMRTRPSRHLSPRAALIRLVQSAELEHQLTGANKLWGLHEVEKQERVIGVLLAAGEHEGGRATGRAAPTADGRGKALAAKVKAADEDEDGVVVIEERVGERKRNSAMEKALRQSRAYNGRFAGGKLKPKGTVAGGGGGSGRGDGSVTAAVVVPGLVPPAPKRPRTGSRPPPQPRAIEFREHEVAMVKVRGRIMRSADRESSTAFDFAPSNRPLVLTQHLAFVDAHRGTAACPGGRGGRIS